MFNNPNEPAISVIWRVKRRIWQERDAWGGVVLYDTFAALDRCQHVLRFRVAS